MIKQIIKKFLPKKISLFIQKRRFVQWVKQGFLYDYYRYMQFSDNIHSDSSTKLIGKIIREYHVIEKGLTMPERRLGFGKDRIISLCNICIRYIKMYKTDEPQLQHAISVLLEYKKLHETEHFLLDKEILDAIAKVESYNIHTGASQQLTFSKEEYFASINKDFVRFSNSRKSIRNFTSEPISQSQITHALELARNTPSACNRQSWRTYVYSDKKLIEQILEIQGGNRGFGHLANKLIIICGEVGMFFGQAERNEVFIDGGMYAMNLLYALHYNKIGACILNCSTSIEKDKTLRKFIPAKPSEVFIAMIVCGNVPETFSIPCSKRYNIDKTNKET